MPLSSRSLGISIWTTEVGATFTEFDRCFAISAIDDAAEHWGGQYAAEAYRSRPGHFHELVDELCNGMQLLMLLLLLANLVILAFPGRIASDSERTAPRELLAHKVRIVGTDAIHESRENRSHDVLEEQRNYMIAQIRAVPECLQWTGISAQDVNRAQAVLDSLGAAYRIADDGRSEELHWVYIPGLANQAAVENVAAQLRAEGEGSFTVSPRTAQGTYYISLGAFRSEESARRQLKRFLRLGAVLEPLGTARTTYIVNDAGAIADDIGAAAKDFEQTTVKQVHCPEVRAG